MTETASPLSQVYKDSSDTIFGRLTRAMIPGLAQADEKGEKAAGRGLVVAAALASQLLPEAVSGPEGVRSGKNFLASLAEPAIALASASALSLIPGVGVGALLPGWLMARAFSIASRPVQLSENTEHMSQTYRESVETPIGKILRTILGLADKDRKGEEAVLRRKLVSLLTPVTSVVMPEVVSGPEGTRNWRNWLASLWESAATSAGTIAGLALGSKIFVGSAAAIGTGVAVPGVGIALAGAPVGYLIGRAFSLASRRMERPKDTKVLQTT